ncbi:MAG TPA: ELWxxDGT repeat protein [Tepidisphaeraceae bacterium]|jgi:uncharacterized delta-60 repeat protein|nr:ELWxxDGT repeat protein [Tepidisphaeraceae bacterium]
MQVRRNFKSTKLHPVSRAVFETLEERRLLAVDLLVDLNTNTESSSPAQFARAADGTVYFRANDGRTGAELWRTDGTAGGTALVADIAPGSAGSMSTDPTSSNPLNLGILDNQIFFAARSVDSDTELWTSDGTEAGTRRLKDLNAGPASSSPRLFTTAGGKMFFVANTGGVSGQLWQSDGTADGTSLVKPISASPNGAGITALVPFGDRVAFVASDANGPELWVSDGTDGGTYIVQDIAPAGSAAFVQNLTVVGDQLYFTARDFSDPAQSPFALYRTNGAAGNLQRLHTFAGSATSPSAMTAVGSTLYVAQPGYSAGTTLFKSDGTSAGTVALRGFSSLAWLTAAGDTLYMTANGSALEGAELWKSDGTEQGTQLVADVVGGAVGSSPSNLTVAGDTLYFTANPIVSGKGQTLYRSGGTAATTVALGTTGVVGSSSAARAPSQLLAVGDGVMYAGSDNATGTEPWRTDGTAAGTAIVRDINTISLPSTPGSAVVLNGKAIFAAAGPLGRELYSSDGTTAGTTLLKDIFTPNTLPNHFGAIGGSSPASLTRVGDVVYFAAASIEKGYELWKTDGTTAGTVLVTDINTSGNSSPANLVNFNGTLYFSADDGTNGIELWKSDGTAAGTVRVTDLATGDASAGPTSLTVFNNQLYFSAVSTQFGRELFRSDGTTAGTVIVKDISASGNSSPASLTVVGGLLYFVATDGSTGNELWRTDGTTAGTVIAKDLSVGSASASPAQLTAVGSTLYFTAFTSATGVELFKSDGTAAGTVLVSDVRAGTGSSSPTALFMVAGRLYFGADDGANGRELWTSDGTGAGTVLVKDINPGAGASSAPQGFFSFNGRVYFAATTAQAGSELWATDGTAAGTVLAADINPYLSTATGGPIGSSPFLIAIVNGAAILSANDGDHGAEPMRFAPPALPPNAAPVAIVDGPIGFTESRTSGPTFNGSASYDPDGTIASYEWDLNYDGKTFAPDVFGSRYTFAFVDGPATFTVALRVTDNAGGTAIVSRTITVTNTAPLFSATFGNNPLEGQSTALNVNPYYDAGFDTVTSWTVDWGDGQTATFNGGLLSLTHAYADNGAYAITGTATDEDGTYAFGPYNVNVRNAVPTNIATNGPATIDEGQSATFNGSFTDAGVLDTHTQSWKVLTGSGTLLATGSGSSFEHTFADNGFYVVQYQVTDDDGGVSSIASRSITVCNVVPALRVAGASTTDEGATYTLVMSASDPGQDTIAYWTIDWGDGVTERVDGNPSTVTHVYAEGAAARRVRATATDEDGTWQASGAYGGTDGVPDSAFAANGSAVTGIPGSTYNQNFRSLLGGKVITRSDGGALVLYTYYDQPASVSHAIVGAYRPDGSLDTSFGVNGLARHAFGAPSAFFDARDLAIDANGKIVISIYAGNNTGGVARLNPNGTVDTTFGQGTGYVSTGSIYSSTAVHILPDGKILSLHAAAGTSAKVVRWLPDGGIDPSFGDAGSGTVQIVDANGLAVGPDGAIAVVGKALINISLPYELALARLTADGRLPATNALVREGGFPYSDVYNAVAIQPDGKIVAVGAVGTAGSNPTTAYDGIVIRYNADGTRDTAFNGSGQRQIRFNAATANALHDVTILPDGKILVTGHNTGDFAAARINANGSLDDSFGVGGVLATGFGLSANEVATGLAVRPDGRFYLTGIRTSSVAEQLPDRILLARFRPADRLQVNNVAPSVSLSDDGSSTATEGAAITLTASATDPSTADAAAGFNYAWTVTKDGAAYASGNTASVAFTPNDNGTYVVSTTATDRDGGTSSAATRTIVVDNVAPIAALANGPANGTSVEGTAVSFSASATDPSPTDTAAGFGYSWSVTKDGAAFGSGTGANVAFTPDDNGAYLVSLTAADKDGATGSTSVTVTVTNATPTLDVSASPTNVVEGQAVTYTADGSDAGAADRATLTYAWNVTKSGNPFRSASGPSASFTPDDNGTYAVSVTTTDKDGATSAAVARTLTVANRAPTATFAAIGDAAQEGSPTSFTFSNADDAAADLAAGLRYSFDFNNDGDFTDAGDVLNATSPTATFAFRDNGSYTVRGRVTDQDGGLTNYSTVVAVVNVGPSVAVIASTTNGRRNKAIDFTFRATDPSAADQAGTFKYHVDWDGNGSVDQVITGTSKVSASRTYKSGGSYNVRVYAVDKDGGIGPITQLLIRIA